MTYKIFCVDENLLTDEPPKIPGYYWEIRTNEGFSDSVLGIVKIEFVEAWHELMVVDFNGDNHDYSMEKFIWLYPPNS